MIILLLAACLPDTFTETGLDVFDRERRCYHRDVSVTFDMKYWKEWYLRTSEYCMEPNYSIPTADGLCIEYYGCDDEAPLTADDPLFDMSHDAIIDCSTFKDNLTEPIPDCDDPILTAWP